MTTDPQFPTEAQEGAMTKKKPNDLKKPRARPPTLNDMFVAGMPLRRAAAFERAIEENPDIPAEDWWKTFRSFASETTPIEFP